MATRTIQQDSTAEGVVYPVVGDKIYIDEGDGRDCIEGQGTVTAVSGSVITLGDFGELDLNDMAYWCVMETRTEPVMR